MSVAFWIECEHKRETIVSDAWSKFRKTNEPWIEQVNTLGLLGRGCFSE